VVWERFNGTSPAIESALRPPGGTFGPTSDLSTGALGPQVAIDAAGDAIVGWEKDAANDKSIVQIATRPAGGTFGAPQNVTGPVTEANLALTMNSLGRAVAAWQGCPTGHIPCGRWVVQAAVRRPGASFTAPVVVSPARQDSLFPGLAINASGDALASWIRGKPGPNAAEIAEYRFGSRATPLFAVLCSDKFRHDR
jgi:hypothetical protein